MSSNNKKISLFILSIALLVVVSGCKQKQIENNQTALNKQQDNKTATNTNENVPMVASSSNESAASSTDNFDSFEVIDEGGGWKKYVNKEIGIEFKFLDKKNEMKINSDFSSDFSYGGIRLRNEKDDIYVYLDIINYDLKHSKNLRQYIDDFHVFYGQGEFYGQEVYERVNRNKLKYYEVLTDESSPFNIGTKKPKRFISRDYVVDFKDTNYQKKLIEYSGDLNSALFLKLSGHSTTTSDIIKTFNFIK